MITRRDANIGIVVGAASVVGSSMAAPEPKPRVLPPPRNPGWQAIDRRAQVQAFDTRVLGPQPPVLCPGVFGFAQIAGDLGKAAQVSVRIA
jgi:hypothetical protein